MLFQSHDKQDLSNILSSIFISLQMLGVSNCSSVIPVVVAERTVLYREMFSGMYSSWAYSFAQVRTALLSKITILLSKWILSEASSFSFLAYHDATFFIV